MLKKEEPIQTFLSFSLPRWNALPEYDLYNEQLVQYINHMFEPLFGEEEKSLTSTMVQNYVKWKILPRPDGKKYGRTHIAWCIVITLLKKIITIPEIEQGIQLQCKLLELPHAYNSFCEQFEISLRSCLAALDQEQPLHQFQSFSVSSELLAVRCICLSLAFKLITERILLHKGYARNLAPFRTGRVHPQSKELPSHEHPNHSGSVTSTTFANPKMEGTPV